MTTTWYLGDARDESLGRGPDGRSSIGPASNGSCIGPASRTTNEQVEAAAEKVAAALRFAATEPYGDLALSADRAAGIAVRALVEIGWRSA